MAAWIVEAMVLCALETISADIGENSADWIVETMSQSVTETMAAWLVETIMMAAWIGETRAA
jgi:hypothetical protein